MGANVSAAASAKSEVEAIKVEIEELKAELAAKETEHTVAKKIGNEFAEK